jgi:hypothetical protein
MDGMNTWDNIPSYFYSAALHTCADRLDSATGVEVNVDPNDMTRSRAISAAKADKERYVVWLHLKSEDYNASQTSSRVSEVTIEYFVYTPTTGKVAASGRVYQQRGIRKGGIGVGVPTPGSSNVVYGEYLLKEAAKETAEQILDALHVGATPLPGTRPWKTVLATNRAVR